ncbi:MAG: hypothetical protein AAF543_21445, partial [Pseudomonadota bacterium]
EELSVLIARMMSKRPDQRPRSAGSVVRQLERIARDQRRPAHDFRRFDVRPDGGRGLFCEPEENR